MIDLVGTVFAVAVFVWQVALLTSGARMRRSTRWAARGVAAGWVAALVAWMVRGPARAATTRGVPVPVLVFALAVTLLLAAWTLRRGFRDALESVRLEALIGLNVARLGGVFFLLLTMQGRLSGPFGPVAGVGDIVVGALAIPLAWRAMHGNARLHALITAWNALGALDLATALTLALLSAPNVPFRVFANGPGSGAMTELPWALVPTTLVPLYLLSHLAIAAKLRAAPAARSAPAAA